MNHYCPLTKARLIRCRMSPKTTSEKRSHKTEIVVAVLSLIGTLGGALFASWDKIFPPSPAASEITKPSKPTCKADRIYVRDQSIRTSGNDVIAVYGDPEIDSDDWTRVSIGYNIAVSQKTVVTTLVWEAQELNSNKSLGDTRIKSQKRITLYQVPTRCTNSVITDQSNLDVGASQTREFRGEQHALAPFASSVGNLRDIRVRFDGPGGSDNRLQQLQGVFRGFSVSISETP